jgi:hypothetical protein
MSKRSMGQAQRDLINSVRAVEEFFARFGKLIRETSPEMRERQAENRQHADEIREDIERGARAPGRPFRL